MVQMVAFRCSQFFLDQVSEHVIAGEVSNPDTVELGAENRSLVSASVRIAAEPR